MAVQTLTLGRINLKKVVAYFKKSNKVNTVWSQQAGDGYLLITDRYALVKVAALSEEVAPFTSGHTTTMFKRDEKPMSYTPAHFVESWDRMMEAFKDEAKVVKLRSTRFLYESRSQMWRRFDTPDGEHVWIDRTILEMFSVDPDGLEGFIWEYHTQNKYIRVGHFAGWCAVVMPGQNIEQ